MKNLTIYSDGPCTLWLLDLLPVSGECFQAYRHGEEVNGRFIRNGSILICAAGDENRFVSYCERRGYHYARFLNGDENWEDSMGYTQARNAVSSYAIMHSPLQNERLAWLIA